MDAPCSRCGQHPCNCQQEDPGRPSDSQKASLASSSALLKKPKRGSKYFIITDDSNFIFCNHPDDPYGYQMCLPYAVAQHNVAGWFREAYTTTVARDDTKIVFEQYGPIPLSFMVSSDRGETETFLRGQLDMVHQLLLMEFGPAVLYNKKKIHNAFFQGPEQQARIARIIQTLCYLCDHKQSFLVQGVESLLPNSNPDLLQDILATLRQGATHPNVCHALLLVGTKRLMTYSKSRQALDPQDLYLLSIWYWSHFFTVSEMKKGDGDCFSDDEEGEFEGLNLDINDVMNILKHGIVVGYSHPMVEVLQCLLTYMGQFTTPVENTFSSAMFATLRDVLKDERAASVLRTETVQKLLEVADHIDLEKAALVDTTDLKFTAEQCLSICSYVVSKANSSPDKKTRQSSYAGDQSQNLQTVYREIHLQSGGKYTPFWVYVSQVVDNPNRPMAPMVLIFICQNMTGSEQELRLLKTAEHQVKDALHWHAAYLLNTESTYSMISYINQLPGLIHFILVERSENVVTTPSITGLFGPESPHNKDIRIVNNTTQILKHKIWDMCYQAQEFLARGYFTMIMKCGEFQYYYNLWFVQTSTGRQAAIRTAFNWDPKKPLTHGFYKSLKQKMEQEYGAVQCYELYALYLNFVPIQMVESHSRELVARLLSGK